jgi:WD40 repeat protein
VNGYPGGALLWFAEALPLLKDHPADEAVHRVRIQQTLQITPTLLQVTPIRWNNRTSVAFAFSPDEQSIAIENGDIVRLLDVGSGDVRWEFPSPENGVSHLDFTRDGHALLVSSLRRFGTVGNYTSPTNVVTILDAQTGRPRFSIQATNLVRANLSPDSQLLLTSSTDHELSLWNVETGEMLRRRDAHADLVLRITCSKNGRVAATYCKDGTVRLWRLPEAEAIGMPLQFSEERLHVKLNGDGTLLATGGANPGVVEVWDVETGQRLGEPIEVGDVIGGLDFLPGEETLLIHAGKGTSRLAEIVDARSQRRITTINSSPQLHSMTRSSDGSLIAHGSQNGWIGVWEVSTGEQRLSTWLSGGAVDALRFVPGGSDLQVLGEDALRLLRLPPKIRELHLAKQSNSLEVRYRLSKDRRTLLCRDENGGFSFLDLGQMQEWTVPRPEDPSARSSWFSIDPAGRQIAIEYRSGSEEIRHFMELWRLGPSATNRLVVELPAKLLNSMHFNFDGTRVSAITQDRQFRTWRTEDGQLERVVPVSPEFADPPELIADGKRFFAALRTPVERKFFAVFSLDGAPTVALDIVDPLTLIPIFYQRNRMAFVAHDTRWTQVLDLASGQALTPRLDHGGLLRWVDFSPDGTRLLTAGFTPEVRIWNLETATQTVPPMRLGTQSLQIGLWSLDGRFIVARSDENLVRVWDATTGEAVTPIFRHEGYVRYAILGQGNQLFTVSLPGRLRTWDLTPTTLTADALTDYAKLLSGREVNGIALAPLSATRLQELWLSLRRRAPALLE